MKVSHNLSPQTKCLKANFHTIHQFNSSGFSFSLTFSHTLDSLAFSIEFPTTHRYSSLLFFLHDYSVWGNRHDYFNTHVDEILSIWLIESFVFHKVQFHHIYRPNLITCTHLKYYSILCIHPLILHWHN